MYRLRNWLNGRNSWTALLAALLGVLAAASGLGVSASTAGGLAAAEQTADTRTAGKPATLRHQLADPSLNLGEGADAGAALAAADLITNPWPSGLGEKLPMSFDVAIDIGRTRDGRTRAPPRA